MRWKGRKQSGNIEDRRGGNRRVFRGGGTKRKMSLGVAVLVVIFALVFEQDPIALLNQVNQSNVAHPTQTNSAPVSDAAAQFVAVVLQDTEEVWTKLFAAQGKTYIKPKLVLFENSVQSACGFQKSAVGPFYCPADKKIYIDLRFFRELSDRFGAPGDFAQAYVIAHEVGHHVQNLEGTSLKVYNRKLKLDQKSANKLSVQQELQADFYAGVWAHHAEKMYQILEEGDIEEALRAAHVIGDDALQKQAQGYVVPDAFTHGSSKQRMFWFKKGFTTGDWNQGNTFALVN